MKVAVISAIFGKSDNLKEFPEQKLSDGIELSVHRFTEKNVLVPRSDLIPRLRAKYFKCIPHHLIDANVFIWMDGSFQITSPTFVTQMLSYLRGHDVAVLKHPDRNSIVDELHFMQRLMKQGNKYLLQRYGTEKCQEQVSHYLSQGFSDSVGLFSCGLFARVNTPEVNQAFDRWWIENTVWTIQDQLSFPFVVEKYNLSVSRIKLDLFNNQVFKLVNHTS